MDTPPRLDPAALDAHLRSRRSVRSFRDEPVPRELLEELIASAVSAPSASNKQPWRFLIVTGRARIEALAAAVGEARERIAAAIPPESQAAFQAYGDYFTRFEAAPVLVVPLCRRMSILSSLVGEGLSEGDQLAIDAMEQDSGLIGTSLALMNLLLKAHALGLGASGMTGPLVALDSIREILGVPPSWKAVAFVPVGWPDEEPRPTARKPVAKVIRWLE